MCRSWVCGYLVMALATVATNLSAQERTEDSPGAPRCQLKIEGEGIGILALQRESNSFDPGNLVVLRNPDQTVDLPVGDYHVATIILKGGCACSMPMVAFDREANQLREIAPLRLRAEEPQVLRIGAPLKAGLMVFREGRLVRIVYYLQDTEGRFYSSKACNTRPMLTVLGHGKPLVPASPESGNFEHGSGASLIGSWQVPLRVGNAELSFLASQDLGPLGTVQSEPVSLSWRWYYHVPGFVIWAVVAILLLALKENRHWQAWIILIPVALVTMVVWPWLVRLVPRDLYAPVASSEKLTFAFNWLVGAWACVWLMGARLAKGRPTVVLLSTLVFLAGSGMLAVALHFGTVGLEHALAVAIAYGICAAAMLLGTTLSGVRCHRNYGPRRFLGWLVLGTLATVLIGVFLSTASSYGSLFGPRGGPDVSLWLMVDRGLSTLMLSLAITGILCLVNLPLVYVAERVPLYRERFQQVLRLPQMPATNKEAAVAPSDDPPSNTQPQEGPPVD